MKCQLLKGKTKCQLYKTIILQTVLYGYESWTLSKAHEPLLGGFEGKILKRIFGAIQFDGACRRRYSKELYSLFNDDNVIKIIKINRLSWAGHTIRRENEEIIKKIMIVKLEGKRNNSGRKMKWIYGVEKDLGNLDMVNWETKVQDLDGWRKFLEQAKNYKWL
jgi:hypothetical protein